MTKKGKKIQVIHVKKPTIGEFYYFRFAGSWEYGKILKKSEELTKHYNHQWFTFVNCDRGFETRYPVSIYNIRNVKPTFNT